jgi:hypothetical protein
MKRLACHRLALSLYCFNAFIALLCIVFAVELQTLEPFFFLGKMFTKWNDVH